MRIRSLCFAGFVLLHGRAVRPQTAQISRPDTLGANFDHKAIGKGTPSDYDFVIGTWTFRYQPRDPATGGYAPVATGTWTFRKTHETLIADEFAISNPSGPPASTMTYRVFNPTRQVWEIQGVAVRRGVWQPGVSWADGTSRYLVQENPERKTLVRIRYYAITADHFLWRADGSRDGGVTWMRDVMLIEATRVRP
jgi:hypothetical protein